MLFFRSEADMEAWLQTQDTSCGATLTVAKLWELSQHWYQDRMDVDYHGRTIEQVDAIFKEVGLVSEFWQ